MAPFYFFQTDDLIQIVNPLSPFYCELGKIFDIQNHYYFVRLHDGILIRVNFGDISPWFKNKEEENLYRAQLFQMQLLAVDIDDREWFDQIAELIQKIKADKMLLLPKPTGVSVKMK